MGKPSKLSRERAKAKLRLGKNEAAAGTSKGFLVATVRTQEEVAAILGLTRARVQQIEREALHKLRVGMKGWNPFI